MPSIIYGNAGRRAIQAGLTKQKFEYNYPEGLDLSPGSELHNIIIDRVLERAQESATIMQTRFESWNEQDQFLTAYKRLDDEEANVKLIDDRKPVSIVFPYTYAILETLLSYMMSAFFRDPLFRYEGYSPDDVMGSILLEKVINLHCNKFKVMLNLHTMFRDAFIYGLGVVAPIWKVSTNGLFEGNALINIDPYRYLPDPNVSMDNIQNGESVGWTSDTNYLDLLSDEYDDPDMFNVKYLSLLENRTTSIYGTDNSARTNTRNGYTIPGSMQPVTEINMYMKIIPKEWKLGNSERPEKWLFRIAGDSVVLAARPANFKHDKFPLAVISPDFDGYSATPLGRLEIVSGLQEVLDFLFNSHIANVRKAINDTLIYDPYLINANDLKEPKAGGLVRMRRPAWGQGKINDSIKQLQINDITRGNIADSSFVIDWMQKTTATDSSAMGSLRTGGPDRLTKAEFQGTATGGMNRLERVAKVIGLQGMQDIGEFFAEHTQQMMDDSMYVKVTGDWSEVLLNEFQYDISRGRMKVSPDQLDIAYDVIIRDGSIPGGNSNISMELFTLIAQNPELSQTFDIVKIFKQIMRADGQKNIDNFIRRGANIQSNEQIMNGVQKGNLVPMQGGANG
jgi:hypothetical protein